MSHVTVDGVSKCPYEGIHSGGPVYGAGVAKAAYCETTRGLRVWRTPGEPEREPPSWHACARVRLYLRIVPKLHRPPSKLVGARLL